MIPILEALQEEITSRQVTAIVGAGISVGTASADTVSWIGLLKHGITRCESVGSPRPNPGWGNRQRAALEDGQLDELLSVASQIESRLGAPNGAEYRRWLRDTVGALRAGNRAVLEALRDLGVPLATTNYDGLIEEVTELPAVTWRDGARIQRVIRGDEPGVLHLHGYWQQPESVVLGIRSYDQVLGDAHAQTVQSALALVKSFLFVGCGAGLVDPNFGAFLQWMRKVFSGAEGRHFRLCRDDEIDAIQKQHPPKEQIFAVGYGATHADLAPFLQRLKPKATPPPARRVTGASSLLPPRPARIFGRDQLVEDLATTLLLDSPPPIAVLGGPGFGKSTLCLAALHDPRVAARFGARRWFVHCDSANTPEEVLKETALALGLDVLPALEPRVLAALSEAPGVLVIDNAETPWWSAPLPTEELLSQLSGISGLALIATFRDRQRPYRPAWREPPLSVTPLDFADSRKVFLAIAGEKHAADRYLYDLLIALDGIPLAIELLAHAAEPEPNLKGLWRRWQQERVALLSRADGSTRLVNAAVSFALSIRGPRMTDEARQLLSVMAVLPDGIAHKDLLAVMPTDPYRAAATLRQVGLASDEAGRLRFPVPIREHVLTTHRPEPAALAPVLIHYIGLAHAFGGKVGGPEGDKAVRRLSADARNIEEMLSAALVQDDPDEAIRAILSYAEFLRSSGFGTAGVLENARQIAGVRGNTFLEAECVRWLGNIALARSDNDSARTRYEEAQLLYQQVGHVLGMASCINGLGDIALAHSDPRTAKTFYEEAELLYRRVDNALGTANCVARLGDIALSHSDPKTAKTRYEEAQRLFKRINHIWGEAGCIKGLGDVALASSDPETARSRYQEAQPLYQQVGNVLGVANCIKGLADIALARSDHDAARSRFEEARPLYQQVGRVLGAANCIKGLADIALARSDHDAARSRFEEARPLYQHVGSVLGVANCIKGLADIAVARSDHDTARAHFEEALALYERIPQRTSMGDTHRSLARVARTQVDREHHIAAAREAYRSIQRDDLIQRLDAEFGA